MDRNNRSSDELHSLWEKLSDLKSLESDLSERISHETAEETSGRVRSEIEARMGFLPPHFAPALKSPAVLENLWRRHLSSYAGSPLPELFREKLSLRLARYCSSPYFIVLHACTLIQLGVEAGEVRPLIEAPEDNTPVDLEQPLAALAVVPRPLKSWPDANPAFEESVIAGCVCIFLGMEESGKWIAQLRDALGPFLYGHLSDLLAYAKSAHLWVESHPEVSFEDHPTVARNYLSLVRSGPRLVDLFQNWGGMVRKHNAGPCFPGGNHNTQYRDFFENASDIFYTYDFEGNVISVNRAAERITGYSRAEILRMKLTDALPPEYEPLARKLLDPRVAGEIPLSYELEIWSKDKKRIALGISTRPVFRGGKAVAVQGIARDITKHKQIEEELQKANQKLEAWVSELEQRTHEMTLLNDMGDILRACLTTEEAYNVIVRVAQQIFPVKVGALYVIAPSRNLVESVAVWGDASLAERSFAPQECWALRRGRTHWVENYESGLICRHIHQPSSNGYLCIPMMAQSEALGILHLMQPENVKMTETKQRMAVTMSEHIAMALSNLRLHETLRSQSIRDPLTGLFNRRFMEESLELEIRRASRNQRPLGMIMMDLDHFKYFNDNFGHEAGDLLLKELGALLKNSIRGEDIACRYGGEEFTLILPEGTGSVTRQRAEFFKEAIRRLDVHYKNQPLGRLTASMGVAVFPEHGRSAQALIEAADRALYRSKNAGRDCVTMAD
ncbi:MAG: diguanylate cyclase [Acidobacteria bacterium]|nr:diguanylate cyclase [Acidobacteriota bacterium]